jgi:hypothetical protein
MHMSWDKDATEDCIRNISGSNPGTEYEVVQYLNRSIKLTLYSYFITRMFKLLSFFL